MVTRITGGMYRARKVRSRTSRDLRPTLESVRAAIYSVLGDLFVDGAKVLDLFAGTGSLGIEALSRGAIHADFVESNGGRCRDIKASLKELGLEEFGDVYPGRVEKVLLRLRQSYRLVLAAPPYDDDPAALLQVKAFISGLLFLFNQLTPSVTFGLSPNFPLPSSQD